MSENIHIIQKQLVDLIVSKRENSLVLQQQFEKMLEEELLPRLEPLFDSLAGPDEWIELDKVEVDLGHLHPVQNNLWLEKTYQEVAKAVDEAVHQAKASLAPAPLARQEVIWFFLRHGYLPWWALEFKMKEAVQKLIETSPEKLLSFLHEKQARIRWVKQFGEDVQKAFLKALAVPPPFSYAEWKEISHSSGLPGAENQLTEKMLQELYWETVWESLQQPAKTQRESFQSFAAGGKAGTQRPKAQQPINQAQHAGAGEEIYVLLAGIVLLHPFLPAFFEKLHLLEGEQFKNEAARERAVHLLYFLATGNQHPDEAETVVLKLLCGMGIETPIVKQLDLNEAVRAEAAHLLESIIHYWKDLEGATPDELRGTFFVRDGKLTPGDLGWTLKVEEKTYDMLLSRLPWGISPIMHTWMQQMLWVEWG